MNAAMSKPDTLSNLTTETTLEYQDIQPPPPSSRGVSPLGENPEPRMRPVYSSPLTALPPELRAMIWHLCLPPRPPSHHIWTATASSQEKLAQRRSRKIWHEYRIPPLFNVNRDARLATLNWMHSHGLKLRSRPAYFSMVQEFDPTRDYVYLTEDVFGWNEAMVWMSGLPELQYNPPRLAMASKSHDSTSSPIFDAQNLIVPAEILPKAGLMLGNAPSFFTCLKTAHVLVKRFGSTDVSSSTSLEKDTVPSTRPRLQPIHLKVENLELGAVSTKASGAASSRTLILEAAQRLAKKAEDNGDVAPWAFVHLAEMDDWFEIVF